MQRYYKLNGFVPIVLIVIIASSAILAGGGSYVGVRNYQANRLALAGDKLIDEGRYTDAIETYSQSIRSWPKKSTEAKIKKANDLNSQQEFFDQGLEALAAQNWAACLENLSVLNSQFPRYAEAETSIEECRKGTAESAAQVVSPVVENQTQPSASTQQKSNQPSRSGQATASSGNNNQPTIGQTPTNSGSSNTTSDGSGQSTGSSSSSSSQSDTTPPVLKNLIVEFGRYDAATGRAGAFLFNSNQTKVFLEFGARVTGPDGPKTLPTFEYRTVDGASVYAAADGYVTNVMSQPETNDYEILVSPAKANSVWFVSYDHVKGVSLSIGDRVTAGQTLGTVGTWQSGLGRTELQVGKSSSGGVTNYCPFSVFSSSLINEYKQKISDLIADWESFKGDASIYDESGFIYPGCSYETLAD